MTRWTTVAIALAALGALAALAGPWPAKAQVAEGDPSVTAVPKDPVPKKPPRKVPAKAAASPPGPATPMAVQSVQEPPPYLTVLCEGKPARYAGETGVPIWVLRSGLVAVENPLRPLTPEMTRVLQVVVGDRGATAYGPDLAGLRRGGTPAALEATLGGAIRWDDALTLLPDPLVIVSEAGQSLARLPFRECVEAPAVKAEPTKPQAKSRRPARPEGEAAERKVPANDRAKVLPRGLVMPQGAIPANP